MSIREDFEKWCSDKGLASNYIGDGQFQSHSIQFAFEAYQAVTNKYESEHAHDYAEWIDERNSLLAVIALKDEALQAMFEDGWLCHGPEGMSIPQQMASDALEIKPDNCMLVEAQRVRIVDGIPTLLGSHRDVGQALYTIEQKDDQS